MLQVICLATIDTAVDLVKLRSMGQESSIACKHIYCTLHMLVLCDNIH